MWCFISHEFAWSRCHSRGMVCDLILFNDNIAVVTICFLRWELYLVLRMISVKTRCFEKIIEIAECSVKMIDRTVKKSVVYILQLAWKVLEQIVKHIPENNDIKKNTEKEIVTKRVWKHCYLCKILSVIIN